MRRHWAYCVIGLLLLACAGKYGEARTWPPDWGEARYRPPDRMASGELLQTEFGKCTIENNSRGLMIITVFVRMPDGAPVANELVHLHSQGGSLDDKRETDRFHRTSEDGCIQFAEATGKAVPGQQGTPCRIHSVGFPDQPNEPALLGCYHNAAINVNKIVEQPGSFFKNLTGRQLSAVPSGPGKMTFECNLEDNSKADVIEATVAVRRKDDNATVPNELVLLEDRGEFAEDLYARTSADGCVHFMESTNNGEDGCSMQTIRLPNHPNFKGTPMGCHRDGLLTVTAHVPGSDSEDEVQPTEPPPGLKLWVAVLASLTLVSMFVVARRLRWKLQQKHSEASEDEEALLHTTGQEMQPVEVKEHTSSQAGRTVPETWEFEIDPEDLDYKGGEKLGQGSYGAVYKGVWRGTEVAIKRFADQNHSEAVCKEFKREAYLLARLRHPNIVLFMAAVIQPNELAIVSEFHPRGNLFRLLHRTESLINPRCLLYMAMDVARGMTYLHGCRPPVVHRDLKSPNLLLDNTWRVKICDLGLSRVLSSTAQTPITSTGTPEWMAPEILRGNDPIDEKCDVFSFGVILWELVTRLEPWLDLRPVQVIAAVGFNHQRLPVPDDLDPDVAQLIKNCWEEQPSLRPDFQTILG